MSNAKKFLSFPCLIAAVACGGDPVDIGDDTVRTGETLSDYADDWSGYAEAYEFDSGSDAIRLSLDENGHGTLEVGNAGPIPPATDPDVAYPEGGAGPLGVNVILRSGFSYTIQSAIVESRRLRLSINLYELYGDWCAMQTTTYLDDANSTSQEQYYACLPNWGGGAVDGQCYQDNPATGERVFVDCGKLGMCGPGSPCTCSADGCTVNPYPNSVELDAALQENGNELEGTLSEAGGATIRMRRE